MKGVRFFQTIQIRLIIIYVLLILIAMQLIGIYFVKTLESSFVNNFSESLNKQAYLLAEYVEPYLSAYQQGTNIEGRKTYEDLNIVVNNLNTISKAEIQIIDGNGVVLSTSLQSHQSIIGQKNTGTEVSRALQGIRLNETTMIDTAGIRNKVLAMPVHDGNKVIGAVYMIASMEDLYDTINRINRILFSGTIIALALTALLGIILSHTITNPIKEITQQATAVAEGDFNHQVKVVGHDEIGQLGNAFNYMTNRLKEALSLNEEEREKLASILSNMSDGVVATDDLGKVIVMNRRAKQMLQIEEKDVAGIDIAELLGMSKEKIGQYVLGDLNTAMIDLSIVDEEEPLKVRVTFTPIHRRERGITGTIAVLQDVTEQEKLEQSRREFVANVSHELRTPLTTIKSYLEALDDGALDDRQLADRFIGVTRNETERMIRLVTDLLHLSRLDSRQAILSKEPTDIVDMLEEVADRFSFQLQQREIAIAIHVEEGIPAVRMDPDQIDQVLDNLMSNAIKYTPEGGSIEIAVRKTENQMLQIAIKDDGIGIPKKDLERIFERFYRVDKARSRSMGGTGLGLSIAREIVKAHGGAIELESEMTRGTKVSFTLPIQQEEGGSV
jgi:two-component system sensor histidine kinase VicK